MGRVIEDGDELGLAWDDWADGRVHRLRRGVHFTRGTAAVEEAARNAALRMKRGVRTVREIRGRNIFIWVQFADHEVEVGSPCPGCGSGDLRRVNLQCAVCGACGATLMFAKRKRKGPAKEPVGELIAPDEVALDLHSQRSPAIELSASSVVTREGGPDDTPAEAAASEDGRALMAEQKAARRDEERRRRAELRQREQELELRERELEQEMRARELELDEARRLGADPLFDKQARARDRAIARKARDDRRAAIEEARLDALERRVEIQRQREEARRSQGPLGRLSGYGEARLFLHDRLPNRERYYGFGSMPDGTEVLLFVRFPLRDGQRVPDPDFPGEDRHIVRWVPAGPFGETLDLDALRRREPDLVVKPGAETAADG